MREYICYYYEHAARLKNYGNENNFFYERYHKGTDMTERYELAEGLGRESRVP